MATSSFMDTQKDDFEVLFGCKKCPHVSNNILLMRAHFLEVHGANEKDDQEKEATTRENRIGLNYDGVGELGTLDDGKVSSQSGVVKGEDDSAKDLTIVARGSIQPKSEIPTDEEQFFVCAECKLIFNSRLLCSEHMIKFHNLLNFNFADIELVEEESKKSVVQKRKVNLPFKYSEEGGVIVPKKFQVTKDSPLYRCSLCLYTFDTLEVSRFHEECHNFDYTNHSSSGFICRICEGQKALKESNDGDNVSENEILDDTNIFEKWSKCSWHLWKIHQIDCELASCSYDGCEFKSVFAHKVREHEGIHSRLSEFRCTTCHKAFKQLKQLRNHEKYHKVKNTKLPPSSESRWYTTQKCDICSRVFSDSKCLKKHIAVVHNKLKPHTCNICGHQSARKAELQLHLRTHTREKPYKCSSCTFATGDHNSLRRHALTHSNEKTYSCPECSFTCIQSAGFKKHMIAKHSEDNGSLNALFVCPYCPHITVNKLTYDWHIRDHDQGRIPIQDMQGTAEDKDQPRHKNRAPPFLHIEDSSSNSNMSGTGSRKLPYWNHDDDSIDVIIDTGGITIPAVPTTEADGDIDISEINIPRTGDTPNVVGGITIPTATTDPAINTGGIRIPAATTSTRMEVIDTGSSIIHASLATIVALDAAGSSIR